MQIIDNYLDDEVFKTIATVAMDKETEWKISDAVSSADANDGSYIIRDVYRDHVPVCPSFQYIMINYVENLKDFRQLLRLRYVMYLKTESIIEHSPHTDYKFSHKGALLYLNTNNGFTRLADGTKVESKENRVLLHDPSEKHNSSTCTDKSRRAVLVCNYL